MSDEGRIYEVSEHLGRLENVCEELLHLVKGLEERCASALSHAAVDGKGSGETPHPRLCPLALRLHKSVERIETACGNINMLAERIEL